MKKRQDPSVLDGPGAFDHGFPLAPTGGSAKLAPAETARTVPSLGATLAICTASQVLATSSVLGLATITPIVASSLSIRTYWIGYQVSLIYFAGIFASAMAGSLIERWGAARLNRIALFCAGGGALGLASGILPAMVAASMLIGVGYAFNNPCSSHMLHRLTPARLRNIIFSIKQAGVPAGGVLAAVVIPPLSVALGWQAALVISAAPCLMLGVLFGVLCEWWDDDRRPTTAVGSQAVWRGQSLVWSHAGLRILSIIGLLYSAIQLCVSAFTVTMLVADFGWSPVRAGTVAAAIQVCGAAGRIVWGLIADLLKAGFLVLAFLGLMTGLCFAALLYGSALPTAAEIGILCVLGACSVGWNGVMLAETARLSSHVSRGGSRTLTGDVLVYTFLGVVLGPSSFALAYSHLGSYVDAFALLCLPALVGTALAGWAHRHTSEL